MLVTGARPRRGALEERQLGSASIRSGDAAHTLVVVRLARAVVAMTERVAPALEDFQPKAPCLRRASSERVRLRQHAYV